jgi:hypothetical protein
VVGAPPQRTTLHHQRLDRRRSWVTVTKVSCSQGLGGFLV